MARSLRVDFSDIPEFELIVPGTYPAVISGAEIKKGAKGDYINWEYTLDHPKYKGQKVWDMTSLSAKALYRFRDFLTSLNISCPEKGAIDVDIDSIVGKQVMIEVIIDSYPDPKDIPPKDPKNPKMKNSNKIKDGCIALRGGPVGIK